MHEVPVFFVSMIVSSLSGFSHETITTCVLMGPAMEAVKLQLCDMKLRKHFHLRQGEGLDKQIGRLTFLEA